MFGVARVDWFAQRSSATLLIPDAANLAQRSPILLAGMRVGQVTSVRNTAGGVEVRFDIDSGRRIPADSTVVIETLSALGEPYIDFRSASGDGPYLADGQLIHTQAVRTPKSIPEVARTVTALLAELDPGAIASLVQTFSQALDGTETVIPQLTHASDLLAATLISRSPQIRDILTNAQAPGPDLALAGAQMAEGGVQFGEFGVKVNEVVKSLQRLLDARPVPDAYTEGNGLIPFVSKLTDHLDRIGPDAQRLYPVIGPLLTRAATAVPGIDLSALIAQALASVSPDGTIRLQLDIK
ncbi:MlaD family protein [Nocardia brasiliensis]|uniref:MlaD family protein n=1 Tax=Nocardia brasiliensis TaxID=37326 RepID=UPI001EEC87D4|nr:MlaD family protein [Nocardia brasiliensis]